MARDYPINLSIVQVKNLRDLALKCLVEYKPAVKEEIDKSELTADEAKAVKAMRLANAHFAGNARGVSEVVAALFDVDAAKLMKIAGIVTEGGNAYDLPKGMPIVITGNRNSHDYVLNHVAFFEGHAVNGYCRQFDAAGTVMYRGNNAPCYRKGYSLSLYGGTWRLATAEEVTAECNRVIGLLEAKAKAEAEAAEATAKRAAEDPTNVGF